jgi:hypothetical protein
MSVEKRINKKGRVYYYDTDQKRFSSKKIFVKDNLTKISNGQIKYSDLDRSEKLSYHAQKRLRYNGKLISKDVEKLLVDKTKNFDNPIKKNSGEELSNRFGTNVLDSLLKQYQSKKFIQQGAERKTTGEIFNVQSNLAERLKDGQSITVIDEDGISHVGMDAILKINEFEQQQREKITEIEDPIFLYQITEKLSGSDPFNMTTEIIVDLRQTEIKGS